MTVLAHYTLRRKDIPLVHFCLEAEQEVTAGMAQTIYQVHVTQVEEGSNEGDGCNGIILKLETRFIYA